MLKLITQPTLKVSHPVGLNLRPSDSAPNFALARNVVSEGFLANLKYLLTEGRVVIPGKAEGSAFFAQHFRASFLDNLKVCFQPTPKFTCNVVPSLRGKASPGIRIESQPLYLSLFLNIRDIVAPPKLPPLELTSKPVEIPEIWSKHRRLSAANVVSVILHVSFTVLVFVFTFRQMTDPDLVKSATVLIAPPALGAPPPPARAVTPTVTRRVAYIKRKSFFVQRKLTAPSSIPNVVRTRRSANDVGAPDLNLGGVPGGDPAGILGGVLGGEAGGIPGGVLGGISGAPPPPGAAITKSGVVRVGGNVKRPRPIYTPEPEFPSLARHAKVTGIVILDAVIDEHGNVAKLHAVSGNGLLINAALKAVAQWKFEPTYLNGVPISVEMEVEVAFHLLN